MARFVKNMHTFKSVLSTIIFSVDMNKSTSVLGWVSPSGAYKESQFIQIISATKIGLFRFLHHPPLET